MIDTENFPKLSERIQKFRKKLTKLSVFFRKKDHFFRIFGKYGKLYVIYAKTFRIFSAFSESFKTIEILDSYELSKVFLFFVDMGKEESHLLIICVNMVLVFVKSETVAIARPLQN